MSNHGISSSESDIVALLRLVKKIPRSVSSPRRREGPTIVFSVALTQVLRLPHAQHVSSLLRANECALRRLPQFRPKKNTHLLGRLLLFAFREQRSIFCV